MLTQRLLQVIARLGVIRSERDRAVLLSKDRWIRLTDLPDCLIKRTRGRDDEIPLPRHNPSHQRSWATDIVKALAKSRGNRDQAAALLGVSRTTLWRRMRKLGLVVST